MISVSVIVPNYNHASFLKKRIDSIINQTFQNFELILLDDASTDSSKLILEKYKNHPKVSQLIYNKNNSGNTFSQWKKGIKFAKGKYIWIAESDDWTKDTFLEKLIPFLENNDDNQLVFCNSTCIDEKEKIISMKKFSQTRWKVSYSKDGNKEILDELIFHNSICNASAIIFRKKDIEKINFLNLKYSGDWKAVIDILHNNKFYYHAEKLNYYRINRKGVTFSNDSVKKEIERAKEYISMMKYALGKIGFPKKLYRERHRWIVGDWMEKKKMFNKDMNKYYFPPFPFSLKIYFYYQVIKNIFKSK
jgi:glycosyltransferase involved in cell wall biosynthesis